MTVAPDILKRIEADFGSDAPEAMEAINIFLACDEKIASDRVLRCIVYSSKGRLDALYEMIELAEKDYRDVICGAEYDCTEEQKRDFNQPFE